MTPPVAELSIRASVVIFELRKMRSTRKVGGVVCLDLVGCGLAAAVWFWRWGSQRMVEEDGWLRGSDGVSDLLIIRITFLVLAHE